VRHNERSWGLDAANHRFAVGDLVTTTKRCWFGPGIRGVVKTITMDAVTLSTDLSVQELFTVRHFHVLVVERRTGTAVKLRKLRRWINERTTR
jgi:hypothetical protein